MEGCAPVDAPGRWFEVRDSDVAPLALPDSEHERILTGQILPEQTKDAVWQTQPVVLFVAGPPGSGKTAIADLLHAVLNERGGAVRIGSDLYKRDHPHYATWLTENDRIAGVRARPDTRRWQAEVEAYVRLHRFDAVVETALADPDACRTTAAAYREAGYRIEVTAVAAPEAWSQLGVLDRYLGQVHSAGAGRYVSWDNHDGCHDGMLETLEAVESERLADRVTVLRRDSSVLYSAELTSPAQRGPRDGAEAVRAEHRRPWSAAETWQFRVGLSRADEQLFHERVSPDRRLAVRRDVERAFALSEPVRRIAQPRLDPPGVDYHRLSADEHRWVFEELIVPGLGPITPHERPIVTYVLGQPGAGKTRTATMVQRALRGRKPTRIVGEDFKAAHPDYHRLLQERPRTAGARIRADYRAWQERAEAYVRERHGDMVIEMAPGDARQFLRSASAAHRAGYRVEVVVVTVRAADSRQGTAARYAEVQQRGGPARFTTASGHDVCFAALADTVARAEEEPVVDSVVLLRRDGSEVYRNERAEEGRWARPARAAQALVVEQQRPYTTQEAARFFAMQRLLRAALPQHRADLAQIDELAAPLMPAHLQPRRLASPPAPTALPLPSQPQRTTGGYCVSSA